MKTGDRKISENLDSKNQGRAPFFQAVPVQAKLKVSKPGNPFEAEAEKVSEQVVASTPVGRGESALPVIQRKCDACKMEELERKELSNEIPEISGELENHISNLDGRGRSMNKSEKNFFEPRFGMDFSNVRIHENDPSAEKINARAYTIGNHVAFNQGEHPGNKKLMAHELTHVVQQRGKENGISRQEIPILQRQEEQNSGQSTLSQDERDWLYTRLTFRMNMAYTKFVDACNAHQRQIRDLAAQNVDVANLVLDVALSFATPGISRIITAGISRAVRQEASEAIYRVALGALDRADQITAAATSIGKDLAKRGFENVFSRSEDEQFVQDLKQIMSESMDAIHANLPNTSDEQLSILYFNHDPSIATLNYYETEIGRMISAFRTQIMPIGRRTDGAYGINRLRWIEGRSRRALALTGEGRYYNVGGGVRLLSFITPYFRDEAVRRSHPSTESDFPVIHYGGLESASIFATLPNILDSPTFRDINYVFLPPVGVPSVGQNPCPSCHGESQERQLPSLSDQPFEFGLQEPQSPTISPELLEWLQQGQ